MDIFIRLDSWQSALLFAVLMIGGWSAGAAFRSKPSSAGSSSSTRIEDAGLALFGLLLAFCFSGAAGRYETRKELLRDDAIAIGELASVGSALEEPDRSDLKREVRTYVEQRLTFGPMRLEDPKMPQVIRDGRAAQERIWTIVRRAIANKNTPTIHTPLMNAFNGVTAAHDKRLYGVRNQVSGSIVLMLVLFGVFTTFTMGRLHDQHDRRGASIFRIGAYIGLVALVFAITVDLEQPRRGLMLVSQTPMKELLSSLKDGP